MSRWLYGEPVRAGPGKWRFRAGGAFEFGPAGSGWITRIPADFVFDVSAPWWAVPLLKLAGVWRRMIRPSGLHDYTRFAPEWSLWNGDLLFPDALRAEGVREPWLTVCWWAVRSNNRRA